MEEKKRGNSFTDGIYSIMSLYCMPSYHVTHYIVKSSHTVTGQIIGKWY